MWNTSLTPQYWSPLTIWGGMALGLPAFALISSRRALSWEISTSSYLMFFPSRIRVTSLCWDLIWNPGGKGRLWGDGEEPEGWAHTQRASQAQHSAHGTDPACVGGHPARRGGFGQRWGRYSASRGGDTEDGAGGASLLHGRETPTPGKRGPGAPSPARRRSPPGSRSPRCCRP